MQHDRSMSVRAFDARRNYKTTLESLSKFLYRILYRDTRSLEMKTSKSTMSWSRLPTKRYLSSGRSVSSWCKLLIVVQSRDSRKLLRFWLKEDENSRRRVLVIKIDISIEIYWISTLPSWCQTHMTTFIFILLKTYICPSEIFTKRKRNLVQFLISLLLEFW